MLSNNRPIIVCGNPRSSTRMHANVLNTHPDIAITDEFHDVEFIRRLLSEYRRGKLLKKFPRNKALVRQAVLAKCIWLTFSVNRIARRGATAKFIGNKTPKIENRYKVLENIFAACPPLYVYCLRSAPKVLKSIKNLENLSWNRDSVATNLIRYIRSVRVMEEMKGAFPERVYVSTIDHLTAETSNSAFFAGMFDFIGVDIPESVAREIDEMGWQNTMEAVKSVTKQTGNIIELTDDEVRLIRNSEDYREIAAKYMLDL